MKELEGFTIGGLDEDYNDHPDREVFLESDVLTRLNHRGGPLSRGVYDRKMMIETPDLQWMIATWPKFQKFKNIASLRSSMIDYDRHGPRERW